MPLIELWKGIKFKMYFKDHNPPHFHAMYQGEEGCFSISDCECLSGRLPPKVNKLILEWWKVNKYRLQNEWERLSND